MKRSSLPLDPDWVENVLEQVERIVAEGDEAFLTERIGELVKQSSPVLLQT